MKLDLPSSQLNPYRCRSIRMDYLQFVCIIMPIIAWILTMMSPSRALSPGQLLTAAPKKSASPTPNRGENKKKCCENGGLCVMGVFCHCPEKFYGFRCEHEMRPCGPVEHGQWARVGCNLCRCFDANLTCLSHIYMGCDDQPAKEEIEISDYQGDMTIFPNDDIHPGSGQDGPWGDLYYDDYDDDYTFSRGDKKKGDKHSKSHNGNAPAFSSNFSLCNLLLCLVIAFVSGQNRTTGRYSFLVS